MSAWLPVPDGPGDWLVRIRPGGPFDLHSNKHVATNLPRPEATLVTLVEGQERFDAGSFGGFVATDDLYEWRRVGNAGAAP